MGCSSKIRVILASGNSMRRLGLVSVLARHEGDVDLLAECTRGREVLTLLETHRNGNGPDVLVVDTDLPDMPLTTLVEAVNRVNAEQQSPRLKVLLVTGEKEGMTDETRMLLSAGIFGVCQEDQLSASALMEALRHVHEGGMWFSAGAVASVQEVLSAPLAFVAGPKRGTQPLASEVILTPRERDVLLLMTEGLSNREIATQLTLSVHTVKAEVSQVLRKLSVTDRVEAVVKAIRGELLVKTRENKAN